MNNVLHILLISLVCGLLSIAAIANETDGSCLLSQEQQIGVMVKNIAQAIESPQAPGSLATIADYGTDSRYYLMIRGWLVQLLHGVQSQLDANSNATPQQIELQQQRDFLQHAIRRIDLE